MIDAVHPVKGPLAVPERQVAARIREIKVAMGMTDDDLVDKLREDGHEVSRTTVRGYQNGDRTPRVGMLTAIARALGVDLVALLPEN